MIEVKITQHTRNMYNPVGGRLLCWEWCVEHIGRHGLFWEWDTYLTFWFESESDAIAFKLRWGSV